MKKHLAILSGIFLFMLFTGATGEKSVPDQMTPQVPGAPAGASIKANMDFGRVPLCFIPNQGQLDGRVAFSIQGRDKTVYFSPGGLTFLLRGPDAGAKAPLSNDKAASLAHPVKENAASKNWVVKLDFVERTGM